MGYNGKTTIAVTNSTRDKLNGLKRHPNEPYELVLARLSQQAEEEEKKKVGGEVEHFKSDRPRCPHGHGVMDFEGWIDRRGETFGIPAQIRFSCGQCGHTLTLTNVYGGQWEPI
jgi:hypothetical protein